MSVEKYNKLLTVCGYKKRETKRKKLSYSSLFSQESLHVLTVMHMFSLSLKGAIEIYCEYIRWSWLKFTPHYFLDIG